MVLGESRVVALLATVAGCLLATARGPGRSLALLGPRGRRPYLSSCRHRGSPGRSPRRAVRCRAARRLAGVPPGRPGLAGRRAAGGRPRATPAERLAARSSARPASAPGRRRRPRRARHQPAVRAGDGGPAAGGSRDRPGLLRGRWSSRGSPGCSRARSSAATWPPGSPATTCVPPSAPPAAIAAPILAISAIAGSLVVALSFTADWTTAQDRAQLRAPLVVETNGDREAVGRLAADPARRSRRPAGPTITVGLGPEGDREEVEVVDLAAAAAARGLTAVRGTLSTACAAEHVAVTETYTSTPASAWATASGSGSGDRTIRPTVVAVVPDAPDLYAEVLLPRRTRRPGKRRRVPDRSSWTRAAPTCAPWSPAPTPGPDRGRLDRRGRPRGPGPANKLGLWVLLGPAGLYAGIAIVNAVLIGASQRRRQLRTIALLGATARPAAPDGGLGGGARSAPRPCWSAARWSGSSAG